MWRRLEDFAQRYHYMVTTRATVLTPAAGASNAGGSASSASDFENGTFGVNNAYVLSKSNAGDFNKTKNHGYLSVPIPILDDTYNQVRKACIYDSALLAAFMLGPCGHAAMPMQPCSHAHSAVTYMCICTLTAAT